MGRVLPILFNTEMVQAILDGRKMVTRRLPTKRVRDKWYEYNEQSSVIGSCGGVMYYMTEKEFYQQYPPCQPGDILYVRETWCKGSLNYHEEKYFYKADDNEFHCHWRPSIHMPKEAARIWLKVTDVRVERLQDITLEDCLNEGGFVCLVADGLFNRDLIEPEAKRKFSGIWDSGLKKSDIGRFGWDANPWVWVIEFERCEKPVGGGI